MPCDEIIYHRTKTRVSLLPWPASRFRASLASFPRAEDRDTHLVQSSNCVLLFTYWDWRAGIFVRSTSLLHGKLLTEKPVRSQVFSLVSEVVDSVPRLLTLFCSRLRQESRGLSSLISNFEAIRNVCVTRGTRINTRFQTWEYCFNFDFKIGKLHT